MRRSTMRIARCLRHCLWAIAIVMVAVATRQALANCANSDCQGNWDDPPNCAGTSGCGPNEPWNYTDGIGFFCCCRDNDYNTICCEYYCFQRLCATNPSGCPTGVDTRQIGEGLKLYNMMCSLDGNGCKTIS